MRLIYPVIALMGVLAVTACSTHSGAHRNKQNLAAKDYSLTYEQVREAAQDGDADAQYALGYMYYYGQNVSRNSQQAQFWIRKAAAQKHPQAVKAIAIMGKDSHLAYQDHESNNPDAAQVTPVRDLAKGQNKWEEVRRPNDVAAQTEQWGRRGRKNVDLTADDDLESRDRLNKDSATPSTSVAHHGGDSLKADNNQSTEHQANRNTHVLKNEAQTGKKHARAVALKNKQDKLLASHSPRANGHAQAAKTPHDKVSTQADATDTAANEPSDAVDSNESTDNATSSSQDGVSVQPKAPKDSAQAEPMLQLAQERNTAPRSAKRVAHHSKSAKAQTLGKAEHAKKPVAASGKAKSGLASKGNKNLTADERGILSAPSSHYTLQLIGTGSQASIQQLIERNHLQHKAKMYRTQLKGKNFYVLIYGNYPSQSEATAEIARLPANVQQLKPWVKQYSSIKTSVNTKSS